MDILLPWLPQPNRNGLNANPGGGAVGPAGVGHPGAGGGGAGNGHAQHADKNVNGQGRGAGHAARKNDDHNRNQNHNNEAGGQERQERAQGERRGAFFDPQNLLRRNNPNNHNNNHNRNPSQHYKYDQDETASGTNTNNNEPYDANNSMQGPLYSTSTSPLQKVLDELNMSILPHDVRLSAILKASSLFDHRDRIKHDYEIHEGAAEILYQKLAFVLTLCFQSRDSHADVAAGFGFGSGSGSGIHNNSGHSYDSLSSYNMPVTPAGVRVNGNFHSRINTFANAHVQGVHATNYSNDDDMSAAANSTASSGVYSEERSHNSQSLHSHHSLGHGHPQRRASIASTNSSNSGFHSHTHSHNSSSSMPHTNTSIASMQRMRSTRSSQASDADYEIAVLTACLERVHRASNESILHTWNTVGQESLPILIQLLERPFQKIQNVLDHGSRLNLSSNIIERNLGQAVNRENKLTVQKVTKILAVYSLIPEAKIAMTRCPGMLAALVKITDTKNLNRMKDMRPISKRIHKMNSNNPAGAGAGAPVQNVTVDNRFGGLAAAAPAYKSDSYRSLATDATGSTFHTAVSNATVVTNATAGTAGTAATFHTAASSNSNASAYTGSNGVAGSMAGAGLYMTEAARFNAIAILTNLAAVEQNRMLLLSESGLVDNIARVVHNERSEVARQCSSLAIMNLSNGDREHVPELAGNELILETLIKLIGDDDLESRRNAAITLFNVACADENTVKLARYKDGIILEVLMQCITSDMNENSNNDEILNDVRTNAAEALFNISCSSIEETTDRMASHAGLLETLALTLRNPIGSKDVKLYCAATLRRMAEIVHAPKRCQLDLLSALVKAAVWTRTTCIAEAFLSQAEVSGNRHIIVEQNGLLNALAKLALTVGGTDSEKIRMISVSTIEHLSREVENREILSQHEGIMLAMTRASYMNDAVASANSRSLGSGNGGNKSRSSSLLDDDNMTIGTTTTSASRRFQVALKHLVGAM